VPSPVTAVSCLSLKSGACYGISPVSGQTTVFGSVAVVVVVKTAVVTCEVTTLNDRAIQRLRRPLYAFQLDTMYPMKMYMY